MPRLTFAQVRSSRFPEVIVKCADDVPAIARAVNECQQRLINCGGETGWWGGWARVIFQISQADPFITLPREFARAINTDVCKRPIRMQNEFYEFLESGTGLKPGTPCQPWCGMLQGYERGVFPTMTDLSGTQLLRVYLTDVRDVGKRVLIDALDQNGNRIYSTDILNQVSGFYLTLDNPFVTSAFTVSAIRSVQKDATYGDILLKQVDPLTGDEVLLSRYAPDELNPAYRRYYIDHLPQTCCPGTVPNTVQVTALCKYEFLPVVRDTDFLVIGNLPALIEEAKATRFSDMDVTNSMQLEAKAHAKAIRLLNDELRHYCGELLPALNFAPFGNDRLEYAGIGTLI